MKVYVYNNLEDMADDCGAMTIDGVTDMGSSSAGGWCIVTASKEYVFPSDIYMIIDKTEEEE